MQTEWPTKHIQYAAVPSWPQYAVGEDGSVWSTHRGCWAKVNPYTMQGYQYVTLCGCGRKKQFRVHRMILESFVGKPPNGFVACHNNGNKTDNRLSNLRWDTHKANEADKAKHGTRRAGVGVRNRAAKLTEREVVEIRRRYEQNPEPFARIAERYSVGDYAIRCLIRRRTWTHI